MVKITGNKLVYPIKHLMEEGLTIRQYYAGLLMQAMITDKPISAEPGFSYSTEVIRKLAVQCADDLIAELNKSEPE